MKIRCALHFVLMPMFTLAMTMFTLAGAPLAHTQTSDMVKAEIPFDFYVGNHKMPAGTYFMTLSLSTHEVDLVSPDHKDRISAMGVPSGDEEIRAAPRLEFDHVAGDYFLKEIKTPEEAVAFNVDKAEEQIAGTTTGTTVTAGLIH